MPTTQQRMQMYPPVPTTQQRMQMYPPVPITQQRMQMYPPVPITQQRAQVHTPAPIAQQRTQVYTTPVPITQQVSVLLQQWLTGPEELAVASDTPGPSEALTQVYAARQYSPIWSGAQGLNEKGNALIRALRDARAEGLEPDDYDLAAIKPRLTPVAAQTLAELELLLSDAFLRYADHLRSGRFDPKTADPEWFIYPAPSDSGALLESAANAASLDEVLQHLSPPHRGYVRLRKALAHYRELATKGGWPTLPDGPKLAQGDRDRRVAILRERLKSTGDLEKDDSRAKELFDANLASAVRRFQRRHGLHEDGVVGAQTRAILNVPVETRIQQILANMERWRWMPRQLEPRYVVVNMAGFELEVIEHEQPVMSMRVIVGKPYRRTPVFNSTMTHLVFHPYWNIPPRIAVEDILPKLQKDPGYLGTHNIKVYLKQSAEHQALRVNAHELINATRQRFPYKLRQAPGPQNPLGRVKFLLPNPFDVYLHDTPSKELFNKTIRTFSSGCIRLEKPLDLAQYVLQASPKWNRDTIEAAVKSKTTRSIQIPEPIPVYLMYWTAWVDESGQVQFREDIYERDKRMAEAFKQRSKHPPTEKPEAVYRRVAFR
jgi:murein L,D-transpeptidase YcbB/YkuD